MLSDDSILRRVPAALNPKQALFIDGIRHAVEIMDLAYTRLRHTLTEIALNPPTSEEIRSASPYAFLDAWAMVDAIDRFRMLYLQMPGIRFGLPQANVVSLDDATRPFRNLRNVADHIAQRADYVVANNGAALGSLSWLTGFEITPMRLWRCSLRPGTMRTVPQFRKDPIASTIEWPTDVICLSAGEHVGNLSAVRSHIELRLRHFEVQLQAEFGKNEFSSSPVINDLFQRQPYELAPGQFPWQGH